MKHSPDNALAAASRIAEELCPINEKLACEIWGCVIHLSRIMKLEEARFAHNYGFLEDLLGKVTAPPNLAKRARALAAQLPAVAEQ